MANNKITFSYDSTDIDVDYPEYGYESIVTMSIASQRAKNRSYTFFDRTNSYDSRKCKLSFLLTELESQLFIPFWEGTSIDDNGRTETITMALDSTSGFFPFGPDKGDTGNFTVKMLSYQHNYDHSVKQYRHIIELIMVTAPAYELPDEIDQGSITICGISGLLMAQDNYGIEQRYNYSKIQNNDGSVKIIDGPNSSDAYETEYIQLCNQSKAAALIDALVTNRDGDITITATNAHMFGYQSSDNYTVNLIGSDNKNIDISVIHTDYDQFEIDLRFYLKSVL
jgi:hypothetical protein